MIKFFRKIRQKLLSENKFSKYLIYAIGEIILVVIGILIAISINNWNQNRIDEITLGSYLKRISEEIHNDIESYESLQKEFSEKEERSNRLIKVLDAEPFTIKNPKQFKDDFFSINGISPWFDEPVAWTQLVQSGELKLMRDEALVESLLKYYARIKKSAKDYEQFPTQIMIDSRKLLSAAIASSKYSENLDSLKLSDLTVQYIKNNKQTFKELVVRMSIISRNYSISMNRHANKGKELLKLLNEKTEN